MPKEPLRSRRIGNPGFYRVILTTFLHGKIFSRDRAGRFDNETLLEVPS
jgi:hypothetical protein